MEVKDLLQKNILSKTIDGWKAIDPKETFSKHGVNATVLKIGDILITSNGTELIKSIEQTK
jgi:streptomycin 6-kinase